MATTSFLEPITLITIINPKPPLRIPLSLSIPLPNRLLKLSKNPNFGSYSTNSFKFGTRTGRLSVKCSIGDEDHSSVIGGVMDAIVNALKSLRKPVIAAVVIGLLMTQIPNSAFGASGGRVGGRGFSSYSSSSSKGYSMRAPSGAGGFAFSAPYYAPSPFMPGIGVGVGVGGGSGLSLILLGFAAFVLVSGFLSDRSEGSVLTATQKTTVLKLQVGLLGMARSFQRDLDRIAESANTSTPAGLHFVLTETTLSLLRHPDWCISGYSYVDVKRSMEEGESRFNQLSIEERGKFDEETLVNVDSIKRHKSRSQKNNGFSNEYIVVTILVAADGIHKLPAINSSADLKEALQKLASIPTSKTLAVEVLWTPQNENDTLSERQLLEDYPLLRPL
ncbi:hypothetical protein Sjap_006554 [Stephania japonica]|uniref:Myelin-associated oligodendrocyte basic protein n=1 Tax=Stephania japonica TaxID=461633 RepID=A0AAP0PMX2_9MAGN